jgi:hypothetical protein
MLFGRSGAWQNDGDGERGGNEQSGRHTVAEAGIKTVNPASLQRQG